MSSQIFRDVVTEQVKITLERRVEQLDFFAGYLRKFLGDVSSGELRPTFFRVALLDVAQIAVGSTDLLQQIPERKNRTAYNWDACQQLSQVHERA